MPSGSGVFSVLPENFFSPLASVNREHYAALLALYYRLFQENTRGIERELVIREFMNYLALHRGALADEETTKAKVLKLKAADKTKNRTFGNWISRIPGRRFRPPIQARETAPRPAAIMQTTEPWQAVFCGGLSARAGSAMKLSRILPRSSILPPGPDHFLRP